MRPIASNMFKIVVLILFLCAVTVHMPPSYASSRSPSPTPEDSNVVESYCESSGINSIVNIESCNLANEVKVEGGCIKIVRDKNSSAKNDYAKNIEED